MSCSSNLNRLVGSCISTFVSSTNSRVVVGLERPPVLFARAALREAREMSWDGAGRSLRSTMVLRDWGRRAGGAGRKTDATPFPHGHKGLWSGLRRGHRSCGRFGTGRTREDRTGDRNGRGTGGRASSVRVRDGRDAPYFWRP